MALIVARRQDDPSAHDDRAVPVACLGRKRLQQHSAGWLSDRHQAVTLVIDVEQATGDHGGGARRAVLPRPMQAAAGSSAGAVLPTSVSLASSWAWLGGVQLCSRRLASGVSSSTLSPQFVDPLKGPLPAAPVLR